VRIRCRPGCPAPNADEKQQQLAIPSERYPQLCHTRLVEDAVCPDVVAPAIHPKPETDELIAEEVIEKFGPLEMALAARMSTSVPFHFTRFGAAPQVIDYLNRTSFFPEDRSLCIL
jgi:hypothetical protein